MFCPKCKSEYREGFTRCSDCDIELVQKISQESKKNNQKLDYVEYEFVMSVINISDISLIKSILESNTINYFIQGESNINYTGAGPARVLVKKDQLEQAKIILKNSSFSNIII